MNSIQVYDGDGVSPIPYTFEDACKVVFPHMGPFQELDLNSARITRGQENIQYHELQSIVWRLTDWMKNDVLQKEIRKRVEDKPGIRFSVYGLGTKFIDMLYEANKFSDWKEEDRPNNNVATGFNALAAVNPGQNNVAIGSQTLSGLDLPLGSAPTSMAVGDSIMINGKAHEITKVINGITAVGDSIMIDGKAHEITKVINGTTFGIEKS